MLKLYLPTLFQKILTLSSHSGSSSLGFTVGMSDFSAAGNIWSIPERSKGWNRLANQIFGITQLEHSPNSPINQIEKFHGKSYKIIFFTYQRSSLYLKIEFDIGQTSNPFLFTSDECFEPFVINLINIWSNSCLNRESVSVLHPLFFWRKVKDHFCITYHQSSFAIVLYKRFKKIENPFIIMLISAF